MLFPAVTGFGQILGVTFEKGVPTAEKYVKSITIQILKWEIEMVRNKKTISDMVNSALSRLPSLDSALKVLRLTVDVLAGAFIAMGLRAAAALDEQGRITLDECARI